MTLPTEPILEKLQFYVTTPYPCGYLPNKLAQSLIATPHHLVKTDIYSGLIHQGFRRSGKFAYRPHCESCNACVPVRVLLSQFKPNRSQKRAVKQHADLSVRILHLDNHPEHFALYAAYQQLRHPSANSEPDDLAQYLQFLCQSNVESVMIEFKNANQQVKIVSVVDLVCDGVSAVYTFYDAKDTWASYGNYAIMWLIEWTKRLNLPYVYLGYWIENSPKMAYKQLFQVQEQLIDGQWVTPKNLQSER